MRKLKLEIDALQVESFAPVSDAPAQAGTVHGRLEDHQIEVGGTEGGSGGGGYTQGTCIGPTFCCAPTWQASCNCYSHRPWESCTCTDPRWDGNCQYA